MIQSIARMKAIMFKEIRQLSRDPHHLWHGRDDSPDSTAAIWFCD